MNSLLLERGTKGALLSGSCAVLVMKIDGDWPSISVFRMTAFQLLAKFCVFKFADVNTLLNFNCVI
jgi:hypothetical protein